MRNLAGSLAEKKFSRTLISTLKVQGKKFSWLESKSKKWIDCTGNDTDIEISMKGLNWLTRGEERILIYNLTIPVIRKNVDLVLFKAAPEDMIFGKNQNSCHYNNKLYISFGELKGGIDPAGADEHWKTANTALDRIRNAFLEKKLKPKTFFIGAAIEKSMANEIFEQLQNRTLDNAANLTNEEQLVSLSDWLINL